jgi:hypothetical protein
MSKPNVFIQYKGTDLCADIWCECGTHLHVDTYFAYAVRCWKCQAIWELPQMVTAVKVESTEFPIQDAEKDEDIDD